MEEAGTSQKRPDEFCKKIEEFLNIHLKADKTSDTRKVIIGGVSTTLSEREESKPHIISLGPCYREDWRLQNMNYHKCLYVTAIRERNPVFTLVDYFTSILEMKPSLEESYGGFKFNEELLAWILIDGCFIIEYLLRIANGCPESDELIKNNHTRRKIEHDMLLLRNQLPLFVLKFIFEKVMILDYSKQFSVVIMNFFNRSSFIQTNHSICQFHPRSVRDPKCLEIASQIEETNYELGKHRPEIELTNSELHLLHLYHRFLHSKSELSKESSKKDESSDKDVWSIPSATVLASAGVELKKKETSVLFDVSFHNGTLEIPSFFIDSFTESMIKNLIAFETCNPEIEPEFTAYVKFLDHIVNTSEDVTLLREKSILDHALGSDEEVASLINSIGGKIFYHQTPCFKCIYKRVGKHHKLSRHKWMATLMHDYFSSPWSFIKLVAAVILLVLAFLQTFFAVLSYFYSPI